ncbi:MAG TPA: MAPEG family protein [Caulobacteraceae bacterium]|jgi:glutathione S-transferase
MDKLDLHNPLFATYVVAATVMILKVVAMSWLTVIRMVGANGGFRSPEDLKKTPFNPKPSADQLAPNEKVERIRRILQNDLESVPFFLAAGFLYVLTGPPLLHAQILLYGYVAARLLHFGAYITAQVHEVRALFWSLSSLALVWMTVRALVVALGAIWPG